MNLVPVPLDSARNLPPGAYFLELEAGSGALDRLSARPELAQAIVAALVSQVGGGVTYAGSGVAWSAEGGTPRRVYAVRLDVERSIVVESGLAGWVAALGALLIGAGVLVAGVKLYRLEPDAIPDTIERAKDTARSIRDVALLAAGLTVAYVVARRAGWLA